MEGVPVIVHVWLIYKDGEDRVYTTTIKPSDWSLLSYKDQGFKVYRAEVDLPIDQETPVVRASGENVTRQDAPEPSGG